MAEDQLYEVFGEVISSRHFLKAFIITVTATFLMYFAAPTIVKHSARKTY